MGILNDIGSRVVSTVTGFDPRIVAGLIGAVALLGSYVGVYYVGKANGRTVEVRTQLQTQVRWRDRAATETRAIAVRNVAREEHVQVTTTAIQATNTAIHEQLIAHPIDYSDVRITIGDVCLLNQARRHWTDTRPADPACGAPSAFTTPSAVSVRDLVVADIDAATQYNELAVTHDQSVEFLSTELLGRTNNGRNQAGQSQSSSLSTSQRSGVLGNRGDTPLQHRSGDSVSLASGLEARYTYRGYQEGDQALGARDISTGRETNLPS